MHGESIHSDISARQNSPPWIRRGGAGASQHGVVGTRAGHTTPATACGHGIPSSTEEGSISSLRLRRAFMPLCLTQLSKANELLQRMASLRNQTTRNSSRHGDLTYVEVTLGIEPDVVGSEKVAHRAGIPASTPSSLKLAPLIEHSHAATD